jgi:hypothetical protein
MIQPFSLQQHRYHVIEKGISMKKVIFIAILLIADIFAPLSMQAQGTLSVSNLGQTPGASASIDSDAWIAQRFIAGNNSGGYILNSVQLLMDAPSGSPSGFNVSIYSYSGVNPLNNLGNLTGLDPTAADLYTYTTSGIMLSPDTTYFVVVTATTPVTQGAYDWSEVAPPLGFTEGINQWVITDSYSSSTDGSSWTDFNRDGAFQLAIYATSVPEPSTLSLAGLGLACLSLCRRGQK